MIRSRQRKPYSLDETNDRLADAPRIVATLQSLLYAMELLQRHTGIVKGQGG